MILSDKKGVTLVELMMALAIISVIGLGMGTLLIKGIQLWSMNKGKTEIQRDVRIAMDLVTRNLRQAKDSTIVIDSLDDEQPPYSRISFTTIKNKNIKYYQKGTEFYQNTASGDYRIMENLRNVIFTYIDTSAPGDDRIPMISCSVCTEVEVWSSQTKVFQLNFEKIRVMN